MYRDSYVCFFTSNKIIALCALCGYSLADIIDFRLQFDTETPMH